MIKGVCGFGIGKIIGEVMIVINPLEDYFEKGKIMVTPYTIAQSIPDMKKAKAVITDHGARTSHAMIVCRDNKIDCVIGTHDATKQLKDGDKVELDLDNHTIIKIEDENKNEN